MSIVVFGSINMDLTTYVPRLPGPGETLFGHSFITVPGGKGANQAVACARLGVDTKLVGRTGQDGFGDEHLRALEKEGVDISGVFRDPDSSTGLAVISVDDKAENSIIVISGANMTVDGEDVARCTSVLDNAKLLMLQNEVPQETNLAVAQEARAKGVLVMHDPAPAKELPEALYPMVNVITPNEVEAEALVGFAIQSKADAVKAAAQLRALGVATAVIKLGKSGAYYEADEGSGMIPAFNVQAVDTVAAGDAFNAGLAAGLVAGLPFKECVRWGTAAGALATTKRGAMPSLPYRTEFEKLIENGVVS